MGDQSLENMLTKIKQPALFFYPRDIFEKALGQDLKDLDSIGFTNTLIIRFEDGKIKPLQHAYEAMILLGRDKILSENFFEILKMSSSLNKEAFLFFLNQYTEHLNTWLNVTEITKNEAKNKASNYESTIQNYLNLQYHNTLDHYEELNSRFGHWLKKANFCKSFNRPIPSIEEIKQEESKIKIPKSFPKAPLKKLKPKAAPKKKAKTATPDVKVIDADLLIHVFNVDAKLLNQG
ncbi:hypothetical protein [Winogradskyella ouciana]|uniref:Uncharacterized protein n=1 Tax=Winogradskyella ouciana TaxID=2608631 RepID=A0A7K1GGM1_9FLAO|nr:hypothetical protein [Winogradskyella ouciana]MTE27558.1 hypothetical protein [Winogradskyella ouciana]